MQVDANALIVKIDARACIGYIRKMDAPASHTALCSDAAEHAWVQLLRAHRSGLGSVERALKKASLPPLEWYDVLLELERGGPLRSRDLQDRLLLAQYNLSRLLDRMEADGLISRERCSEDARCRWLRATAAGKAIRRRMWPVYAQAIDDTVGARLSPADARTLALLLSRLTRAGAEPASRGELIL